MPRSKPELRSSFTPSPLPSGFLGRPRAERHTGKLSQVCWKYSPWVNCHHGEFGLFGRQPWNPNYCSQEFSPHGNHSVSWWNFILWVFWTQWKGNYNRDPCTQEVQSSLAEISSTRMGVLLSTSPNTAAFTSLTWFFVVLYINRCGKKERSVVQRLAAWQSLMLGDNCGCGLTCWPFPSSRRPGGCKV